ncbi:MAG: twin-arginine translocase subunit TatC [Fuerstiella sp.]
MPRNRDLFDDTTMSFGEHLEVLRVHVWRAILGLTVGIILALFFGDSIIGILRQPIDDALRRNNMPAAEDDLGGMDFTGFLKQLFSDEEPPPEPEEPPVMEAPLADDELEVRVSVDSLLKLIESVAPGTVPANSRTITPTDGKTGNSGSQNSGAAETPDDTDPADATVAPDATDSKVAAGDAVNTDKAKRMVPIILKSPDIALFKQTADRFNRPVTYKVEEAFMTYIKVSMVAGLVITSPWVFYQIWLFVAAGLYPHERKYVHVYLPMSICLFIAGAVFCFYFVFPIVLDFLISFNKWIGVELQPRLSEYISLVLMLPVMFGISFQLPMIMLFLERIGIMTVQGYLTNWRMAVLIISVASMLLTPSDPTSMMLMMLPLVVLYFGGIMLCRFRPGAATDPLA